MRATWDFTVASLRVSSAANSPLWAGPIQGTRWTGWTCGRAAGPSVLARKVGHLRREQRRQLRLYRRVTASGQVPARHRIPVQLRAPAGATSSSHPWVLKVLVRSARCWPHEQRSGAAALWAQARGCMYSKTEPSGWRATILVPLGTSLGASRISTPALPRVSRPGVRDSTMTVAFCETYFSSGRSRAGRVLPVPTPLRGRGIGGLPRPRPGLSWR